MFIEPHQARILAAMILAVLVRFQFTGELNSDIGDGKIKPDAPTEQLYDLVRDSFRTCNLVRNYPEAAARLKARLAVLRAADATSHDR